MPAAAALVLLLLLPPLGRLAGRVLSCDASGKLQMCQSSANFSAAVCSGVGMVLQAGRRARCAAAAVPTAAECPTALH